MDGPNAYDFLHIEHDVHSQLHGHLYGLQKERENEWIDEKEREREKKSVHSESFVLWSLYTHTHMERELYGIIPIKDQNGTRDS